MRGGRLGHRAQRAHARRVDDDHLAGLDVADVLGPDEVEGAGLAREHVGLLVAGQEAQAERADPHRIAHADDGLLRHEEERVGALHPGEGVGDSVFDGDLLARRDQVNEHLGVAVALEDRASRLELGPQLLGVREVSVVAHRQRAARVVDGDRLGVLDVRAPRGGVAHVPDGATARQLRELVLREGVLHEAHRPVGVEHLAVARDDAGRLLPAVLQGVQAEVGDVRRLGVTEDPEDAAHLGPQPSVSVRKIYA